jgi:hypothetical protein
MAALELRLQLFCGGHYKQLWEQALRENANANNFSPPVTRAVKRQRTGGGGKVAGKDSGTGARAGGGGGIKEGLAAAYLLRYS